MSLVVDTAHLGTPEAEWMAPGVLDRLPPWQPPRCRRVVVVAPHPDDEVLGAPGAVLTMVAAGASAALVAVTDGDASHPASTTVRPAELAARRRLESVEGLRRLGLTPEVTVRLGLPDGHVAAHEDAVADAVGRLAGPGDVVLATWAHDGHRDHDACGRAARAACATTGATLVEYLVWAWHWASPAGGGVPLARAVRLPLPRRVVAAKRWAIAAHRSQVRALSDRPGDEVVLPAPVLRRAWRPFEVLLAGGAR